MGREPHQRQDEIIVDARGRTSLQRVRTHGYDRYLAREHEDGTIVLTPAITVTPAELDEFLDNPEALGVRRERPARTAASGDKGAGRQV